jgi:hypothetical protein
MTVDEIKDKVEELIDSCGECHEYQQGMCDDVTDITCWTDCDNRKELAEIQNICPHPAKYKTRNPGDESNEVIRVCSLCHQHVGYRQLADGTQEIFNPNECEVAYKNAYL